MFKTNRPYQFFSDELKRRICEEVVSGQYTKEEVRRRYGIQGCGNIYVWLRKFGYDENQHRRSIVPVPPDQESPEALKARIEALERELAQAKLRAKGLDTMIDIAEEQLKISIRKKSATKRSSGSGKQSQP